MNSVHLGAAMSQAINQLDLNLLKVFESIYQEQNMSRAADVLHITPSAVSHALKRLREVLGDPLFVRSQHSMLPTSACQRMAPQIIDNLSRLRQILQHWGNFVPVTSQHHFRIGLHYALEPTMLTRLITMLHREAPFTSLASIKVERTNLTRALAAGHIDVALDVALPIKAPVMHKKLVDDEFCVVLRQGHPLLDSLNKQTYLGAQHIGVSNRPSGAAAEDIQLQQQGLSRRISLRCQNYYAAAIIAGQSDLLLTLPSQVASQIMSAAPSPSILLLPMPIKLNHIETHLYWHTQTDDDPALSWLRQQIHGMYNHYS